MIGFFSFLKNRIRLSIYVTIDPMFEISLADVPMHLVCLSGPPLESALATPLIKEQGQ